MMGFLKIESVTELSALVLSLRSSSNFKTKLEAAALLNVTTWGTARLTAHDHYLGVVPASQTKTENPFLLPSLVLCKYCSRSSEFLTTLSIDGKLKVLRIKFILTSTGDQLFKMVFRKSLLQVDWFRFFFVLVKSDFSLQFWLLKIISKPRQTCWDILQSSILL